MEKLKIISNSHIIEKPSITISPELIRLTQNLTLMESQVIVHCMIDAPHFMDTAIRIWPTTYLYDLHSDHRSELVHFENISAYPEWKIVPAGTNSFFTLIFGGLPKSCSLFDLIEDIPQSDGFVVRNIQRNSTDVYYVQF